MVPCPFYPFAVEEYRADPAPNLGIHITLTPEWDRYRWRPLTGSVAGLVDDEGYFHRRPGAVVAHADPRAVEYEMAAQIERALADGIRPTHIDAHMGTAFLPPFIERLWALARRYDLPLPVCRDPSALFSIVGMGGHDPGYLGELIAEAGHRGDPVFDSFLIGFTPEGASATDFYATMIDKAPKGLHWLAMHANAPDDTATFAPRMVWPRTEEYRLFASPEAAGLFEGAQIVNWFDLGRTEATQ